MNYTEFKTELVNTIVKNATRRPSYNGLNENFHSYANMECEGSEVRVIYTDSEHDPWDGKAKIDIISENTMLVDAVRFTLDANYDEIFQAVTGVTGDTRDVFNERFWYGDDYVREPEDD